MVAKEFDLHTCTTGQLFSIREKDSELNERSCVFSGFRYGAIEGPDAVLILYGVQGSDYFPALRAIWDEMSSGCCSVMGYIWVRHIKIYQWTLRGFAKVEVLWRGYPYGDGEDDPEFAWTIVRRIKDGKTVGPKMLWE